MGLQDILENVFCAISVPIFPSFPRFLQFFENHKFKKSLNEDH